MGLLIQIGLYGPAVLADYLLFSPRRRNLLISLILGVVGTLVSVVFADAVLGRANPAWLAYAWAITCTGIIRALINGILGFIARHNAGGTE